MSFTSLLHLPEIILGAAGAGKTTYLVERTLQLMEKGADLQNICVVNFTRKANEVFVKRLFERLGKRPPSTRRESRAQAPFIDTLHGLTWRLCGFKANQRSSPFMRDQFIAKEFGYTLEELPEEEMLSQRARNLFYSETARVLEAERVARVLVSNSPSAGLAQFAQVVCSVMDKRKHRVSEDLVIDYSRVLQIITSYDKFKKKQGLIDYEDVLVQYVSAGPVPPIRALIVDECQDINPLQFEVISKLAQSSLLKNVIFAGDDDQAIYTWMGVDPTAFIQMRGEVTKLEQSYRVPESISKCANTLIQSVSSRREKTLRPRTSSGRVERRGEFNCETIQPSESTTILTRTHTEAAKVRRVLSDGCIPFVYMNKSGVEEISVRRSHLASVRAFLKASEAGQCDLQQAHEIVLSTRENCDASLDYVREALFYEKYFASARQMSDVFGIDLSEHWSKSLTAIDPRSAARIIEMMRYGYDIEKPLVRVSTIHAFKGGEDDHIVYVTGRSAMSANMAIGERDSEIRTSYVALTRAREKLTLCAGANAPDYLSAQLFL